MQNLEYKYVNFLLHNITSLNKEFREGYELYNEKHPQESKYEFYFDYELAQFMAKLLQQGNHFKCPPHEELEKLFQYTQMVSYFQNIERLKYQGENLLKLIDEPNVYLNKLSEYCFSDSILVKFMIHKDTCTFFFENALVYGNKDNWDDEDYIIKGENLKFHFEGVKDMKFSGSFDLKYLQHSRGYEWEHDKVSDGRYRLAILCIASYEHFIIEFTYSTVRITPFDYENFRVRFQG
ncbi:hypothetical protein acsn021_07990 [Anaerocolumna cellulosilytica]|uniref:Uncharacterized protein n=1 Tax=Anaerocolumna cellulosilytica TaxID=433286 RepID=A0A6S6R1P0_9FIRM|nr:hypothetical protein [Anaerocolumna cellulosilytica]MBB5197657.1 hypothetical protein [Anaerocolumna cellulosilytica]BCJ93230.1 hypothetical protein acsn021_07990 [Anaerocolumna cellulosilytica]